MYVFFLNVLLGKVFGYFGLEFDLFVIFEIIKCILENKMK